MRLLVVGGHGFLGWHLACRAHATRGLVPHRVGRAETGDPDRLACLVRSADVVLHLAAVNRAPTDDEVHDGTLGPARAVATAIRAAGRPVRVVHAGSVASDTATPSPYGAAKSAAARVLAEATHAVGGGFADVVLPNLFGEHGRPAYHSFVATFCDRLAVGGRPEVLEDRLLPLAHAQDAAEALLAACEDHRTGERRLPSTWRTVSEVATTLGAMHTRYAEGQVPDVADPLDRDLFNTYRSHRCVGPVPRPVAADERGRLFEVVRAHGGTSQAFVSTTAVGRTRGEHYHLRRFERFGVVSGEAEVRLRRLWHDDVVTVRLCGATPAVLDMPTMWAHAITNVGGGELVTAFWADQHLDPVRPDQYPLAVGAREGCGP